MAADTREETSSKAATPPTSTLPNQKVEPYAVPVAPPNANANALPQGAGLNTAGGKPKEAGLFDALRTIKPSEFKEVHQKPCVRDALLTGIGGGFGIGGVRAIWGATVWSSCNWAVGSFVFGSFLMYEFCQRRRLLEMAGMKRAVEVIDRKQAEKQRKAEEFRSAKRKAQEEK
ncbi:hypothetical protein N7G274_007819 [Stereocaulon virgatum]|uniref:Cytochrome c oxidase assembly protein COX20, mitochondrial n=1 Tax=Stereocaulon virgatum TaxID=373712 RepID=A0ABR4A0T4_9LECA